MSMPLEAPTAPELVVRLDDAVPVIYLPTELPFDTLRAWLTDHIDAHADTIQGRASRLDLGERTLELFDLRRLVHHLQEQHDIEITGIYATRQAVKRFAERELKLKLFEIELDEAPEQGAQIELAADEDAPPPAQLQSQFEEIEEAQVNRSQPEQDDPPDQEEEPEIAEEPEDDLGPRTLAVNRTLRSGHSVRFEGHVTVYGDVNPGAQIVAAGNILVLGALKGVAHAGATGDEGCFILSFDMQPTQLRIARKIAIVPSKGGGRTVDPEIAIIRNEHIVIEQYRSRLPR